MKKTAKLFGIIVLLAIIGLIMFACVDGSDGGTTNPCKNGHTSGATATCETAQICTICSQVIAAAIGHNWGEWESDVKPATCTLPSHDNQNCLNTPCSKKNERTGSHPALGHNLPGAKAATCVATGLTGTGHCNRCNRDLTGDVIPIDPDNHSFGEWAQKTAATCIAPKRLIRICSHNTAHSEEENNGGIDPTAHDWNNWTLNAIAATCVTVCKDTATCKNTPCTATNERDGSNVALGHDHASSLICKRENCDHQYEIGDTGPAGGIIFYVATDGFTVEGYEGEIGSFDTYTAYYLEAAPTNDEPPILWCCDAQFCYILFDITAFSDLSDSKASLIGNGRRDTNIIADYLTTIQVTDRAAQVCISKNINGFTDWFLPSLGELNEIFKSIEKTGIQTINNGSSISFWSSSQNVDVRYGVWFQYENGQGWLNKTYSNNYVRAIRAF